MNAYDLELLLEECRKEIAAGRSLKDILADNPVQAERLEPLLKAIIFTSSMSKPKVSESAVLQGKNRLLSEVDDLRNKDHFLKFGTKEHNLRYSGRWFENIRNLLVGQENTDMKLLPRMAIYLVITVLIGGFFTVNASASSLPGDALYGLKLNWEQAQLALTFSDERELELEDGFELERLSEVESLLSEGREEDVEFYGVIEEMGDSFWIVSGVTLSVGPETDIMDSLEIGDLVKVEAVTREDGSLFALEIYLDLDDLDDESVDDLDHDSDDDDNDSDDTPEPEETDEPEQTPTAEDSDEDDEDDEDDD